jgi:hypothetical protein
MPVVGYLGNPFRHGLKETGYVEDQNVMIRVSLGKLSI